ncbi:MAG: molybdopterin-dependent oxidoreductase [Acidimicrobiia bacterium]
MTTSVVLGTCHHDCPDSCGWVVTVEDGRAVKLRGNPDHPYSRGELCPKVNRFLERVYHPDRVLHPLIRTGPKGAGDFRQASWDEALDLVASRLRGVIDTYGGEAIVPWGDAGTQGLIQMSWLDGAFFAHLGASRQVGSLCGGTASAGFTPTYGSRKTADPTDVRHSKLVVLWATNTFLTNRHLWPFIEEARSSGAKVVVIDPIRTITADKADWFIQPLPGTDVALMLGLMHVLIRDDLVDHDYLRNHATGFEQLSERVAEWTPEKAGEACGLDPVEIVRLATEYGTTRPAFIRTLIGAEHREQGAMFFRTLGCLPILTGSWKMKGGGLSRSVGVYWEELVDESMFEGAPETREVSMNDLGRVLTDPGMGVHALFVWNGNPVVSVPNAGAIRRGLEREDLFTVVSEQFLTDTALYADVVFPATTQIEQLDMVGSWGHLYLGWNAPAIEPLGEAVPNSELWRRLARAMGIDDPMFDLDDETLIRSALPTVDIDLMMKQGFLRIERTEEMLLYGDGGFGTPDGKAALYSGELASLGHDPLPSYQPAIEGPSGPLAKTYPLMLLSPKNHTRFLNSTYSGHHRDRETGPYVEIDPADAAARGISEGDPVRVWNERGALSLPARISTRLRPGVVAIPWAWWGKEANVNILTSDTPADWGGGVAFFDTLVEAALA